MEEGGGGEALRCVLKFADGRFKSETLNCWSRPEDYFGAVLFHFMTVLFDVICTL